ncbi:uncharacterized protein LOC129796972 [Lutzomyia longipalpis]|uniref:uncharacterized protein LOC129796972 n=1 Tax=Lutzomyia longipalpis TaxID=7200 RepID=UPI00248374A2|nr:uncharacterized protein LOC129796972 [Lutzomyia longipalpis]XP_055695124.1 uncharacterized protein LOC129796972 [Lutzomyia longipalpis]
MIKGYRQRYYNDESIHSPRIPLPEAYQSAGSIRLKGNLEFLEKCLDDLSAAEKEVAQLDILNEFLEKFTRAEKCPDRRRIVYRFVFEWRIRTYDHVISYYFKELLQLLLKKDPAVLKDAVGDVLETVFCEYQQHYDSLECKSNLARKITGFFDDFAYTAEAVEIRWKNIFSILTEFMEISRSLSAEVDETLAEKFLFNSTSGINSVLYRFDEKISRDSCREKLESLLPNLSHYLPNARLNREIRNFCGNSVIVILKKLDKLMDLIEAIEAGTVGCTDDVIMLYFEGMFRNPLRIIQGRENMCRILRICAKIIYERLYEDFWGDSLKTHFVMAIVMPMCHIIREDLSEVRDWKEEEEQDLLTCLEIFFTLCQKTTSEHYFLQSLKDILYFCMNQTGDVFGGFEERIFLSTCSADCSPKWRGRLLLVLCEVYSSSEVLQRLPDMIIILRDDMRSNKICDLTCHGDSCSHQNPSIQALVELCKTTTDLKDQYDLFLKPLLCECQAHPHGGWFRKQVKSLLRELVSWRSDVTLYIIQDTEKIPIEMILYAQNCMKKYPQNFPRTPVLRQLLKKGLVTFEEDTRVAAAKVFAEISGDLQNLDLFLDFLRFGIVLQHKPHENKINWLGLLTSAVSVKNRDAQELSIIADFVEQFREILFQHFYAGGSFPRQRYALKILKDTWGIFSKHPWELRHLDGVFSCFDSPYEFVKRLTVDCLKKFPERLLIKWIELRFGKSGEIQQKLKDLMTSAKPSDSLEAAYLLILFSSIAPTVFPNALKDDGTSNIDILTALEWCHQILQEGIVDAKKSILKASASNPLYGTILCIRYLLDDLPRSNFKSIPQFSIKETPRWKSFYEKVLLLCNEASQIVAPIVNNSSPEGFFPEDSELLESTDERVTPQMVLLCGWRTIKEVTLLLGEICEKTPISTNLISNEEIIQIGENFIEILLESKHRGAFEVSAVGFSKLCMRLRLSECPELNKLPKEWLEELLNAVLCPEERKTSAKYVKLCVTRRSAGLPFIIQSIITSYDPLLLDYAINRLHKESKKNTEGRVHSMNILRYIFRCSALKTINYVKDGIKVAIESFGSAAWTERNSATLLFSALIVRMFGVCRAKGATEELPFVNTWIFNEFFEDAPMLYDFMYNELKEGSEQLVKVGSAPQLYPIFLLLERLPTLNGHYGPKWDSGEYVREIERISARCHDLRIRVLAVKALITIIHPTEYEKRIEWLLRKEIPQNSNDLHSRILQIREIFRKFAKKDTFIVRKYLNSFVELYKLHSDDCLLIGKLFMEILAKYLPKDHEEQKSILSTSSHAYLMDFSGQMQKLLEAERTVLGRTAVQSSYLILKLTLAMDAESIGNVLMESLRQMQNTLLDPTHITALNVILLLNGDEKHEIPEEILNEIPDNEIEFVSSLNEEQREDLKRIFYTSEENLFESLTRCDNSLISCRAYLCMPLAEINLRNCTIEEINETLTNDQVSTEEKICAIRKVLVCSSKIEDIFALDVESLVGFCSNEMNDFTRLNIALLVEKILRICSNNTRYERDFHLQLLRVIMQLLRDDEPDVRRIVCRAIWCFSKTLRSTCSNEFLSSTDEVNIPCDSYALFLYIETLIEFIIPTNESRIFLLDLIAMEEDDALRETEEISNDEWKVFDTKEANLFADRKFTMNIVKSFVNL